MKLNTTTVTLTLMAAFTVVTAQNLVNDPRMLSTKCVSSGFGEINKTQNWTNANGGTVDLFTPKKSRFTNGVPTNFMGRQPTEGLYNYAGITAFYEDGKNHCNKGEVYSGYAVDTMKNSDGYKRYSEYLQGELAQPLVAGNIYNVSFKVNLADKSARAVSCLGAYLTNTKVEQKSNSYMNVMPQIITHRIISDTGKWVTVSGSFIATGGEQFITIGLFKDGNFNVKNLVDPKMEMDSRKAYYYVTDVSVAPYNAPDMDAFVLGIDFIELTNLQFATGSSKIEDKFTSELNEVAKWMKNNKEYKFYIVGHADKQGSDNVNDPLSLERAKAVKNYLTEKGVNDSNLIYEGLGSANPIESKYKSRLNRRVEIYLIDYSLLSQAAK
jgi:OmpA-OmpF porin, OOP family